MPTLDDLGKLATELYKGNPTVGAKQTVSAKLDTSKAASLGFTGRSLSVWSGEEDVSDVAIVRSFEPSDTSLAYAVRDFRFAQAVCVGE